MFEYKEQINEKEIRRSIYLRFFNSSNRRARSSKPVSSVSSFPVDGAGGGGVVWSCDVGTCGNGSWKGTFGSASKLKPRRGAFADDDGNGGGIDGPKLMFGYWGWGWNSFKEWIDLIFTKKNVKPKRFFC